MRSSYSAGPDAARARTHQLVLNPIGPLFACNFIFGVDAGVILLEQFFALFFGALLFGIVPVLDS